MGKQGENTNLLSTLVHVIGYYNGSTKDISHQLEAEGSTSHTVYYFLLKLTPILHNTPATEQRVKSSKNKWNGKETSESGAQHHL